VTVRPISNIMLTTKSAPISPALSGAASPNPASSSPLLSTALPSARLARPPASSPAIMSGRTLAANASIVREEITIRCKEIGFPPDRASSIHPRDINPACGRQVARTDAKRDPSPTTHAWIRDDRFVSRLGTHGPGTQSAGSLQRTDRLGRAISWRLFVGRVRSRCIAGGHAGLRH
jgi:hypothetical protein